MEIEGRNKLRIEEQNNDVKWRNCKRIGAVNDKINWEQGRIKQVKGDKQRVEGITKYRITMGNRENARGGRR